MKSLVTISVMAISLTACSEAGGGVQIDPTLTSQFCKVTTAAQFDDVSKNKTARALGAVGKYNVDAVTQRSDDAAYDDVNPTAVTRNTLKVARGISIKLNTSGQTAYIHTKKDALIQMTSEGPICGSTDFIEK